MAVDINLIKSLIGDTDPLYNIYQDQGLFDEGNIVPYSEDVRWEDNPAGLAKKKERTAGYTRPGNIGPMVDPEYDTRLFVKELDKFKKPQAPLYNAPGMTSGLDENITDYPRNRFEGRAVGVDKFGNTQYAPKSKMEDYVERYGPNPGTYSPSGLWEGRSYSPIWDAPTITEKNKGLAGIMGHEARHQLLGQNPEFYEDIDPSYVIDEEDAQTVYGAVDRHELLNRMLDFQANSPYDTGIYNDIYGTIHGNMPRHLYSPIADKYYDQATAFTKYMLANPKLSHKRDRSLKKIAQQTIDYLQGNAPISTPTSVPVPAHISGAGNKMGMAQGRDRGRARGRGETGQIAGSHHFSRGGLMDIPLPGRSRDI